MTVEATTTVRTRPAAPGDVPVCAMLDHSTITDHVWQMEFTDLDGSQTVSFRMARLPREMRVLYPRSASVLQSTLDVHPGFLVAERGNKVVGYANMRQQPADEVGWVVDLVVDQDQRGQGIGTQLLSAARQLARDLDLRRIIVETATKNYPAICFLQKNGLAFCGYNDLYYPNRDIALFFGQSLR